MGSPHMGSLILEVTVETPLGGMGRPADSTVGVHGSVETSGQQQEALLLQRAGQGGSKPRPGPSEPEPTVLKKGGLLRVSGAMGEEALGLWVPGPASRWALLEGAKTVRVGLRHGPWVLPILHSDHFLLPPHLPA